MVFCCILQYFVAKSVFLQFTLFCREISFGTIYAILRGEKFSQKLCPWRKNDKYEVWVHHTTFFGTPCILIKSTFAKSFRSSSWKPVSNPGNRPQVGQYLEEKARHVFFLKRKLAELWYWSDTAFGRWCEYIVCC